MALCQCSLDFCYSILVHLLQTWSWQESLACQHPVLWGSFPVFCVSTQFCSYAWHGFTIRQPDVSIGNLDRGVYVPGAVRCVSKDVCIHQQQDCVRSQYWLPDFALSCLFSLLGICILLLVVGNRESTDYKSGILY